MAQVKKKMQIKEVSNYLTDFSNKRSLQFWHNIRQKYTVFKLQSLKGPYPKPWFVRHFQNKPDLDIQRLSDREKERFERFRAYSDLIERKEQQFFEGNCFEGAMASLYVHDVDRRSTIDEVERILSGHINIYNEIDPVDQKGIKEQLEVLYDDLRKFKKFYTEDNQQRKVSIITPVPWRKKNKESELVGELDAYCLSDDRRRIDEFKCITSPSSSGVMKGYCQLNLYMLAIKDEKPTNKEELRFKSVRERRDPISNLIILNILTKKLHRIMIPFERDVYDLLKKELVYFARKR